MKLSNTLHLGNFDRRYLKTSGIYVFLHDYEITVMIASQHKTPPDMGRPQRLSPRKQRFLSNTEGFFDLPVFPR